MNPCLAGLRVLDLSRVLAGPWATQLMADLGAEVVKIEHPAHGDDTRSWGPPFIGAEGDEIFSAYFLAANRGKKSLALDMASPEGREIVRRLASQCDIVVENFKVGGLRKLGLDYEALSAENPRLIYCSISGFGQTGPHRHKPGYDLLVQAMGGLMSITGTPDGEPLKVGVALTDILTGLYSTVAILAALRERDTSGLGQHIDLALLDVQIATLANQGLNYLVSGRAPRRTGNAHPNIVPYQAFEALDGHLVVAVGNDTQFSRFVEALGLPELAQDPSFTRNRDRVQHRDILVPLLSERIATLPRQNLLDALEKASVPAAPINDLAEVFADPQVEARGLTAEHVLTDQKAPTRLMTNPIKFSRSPASSPDAPPALGGHTAEILSERLGIDRAEIEALVARGIVKAKSPKG